MAERKWMWKRDQMRKKKPTLKVCLPINLVFIRG